MKKTLVISCILFISIQSTFSQTNLLDTSTWTLGDGSVTGFNHFGDVTANSRIMADNPYGEPSNIWQGTPQDGSIHSGGWTSTKVAIDHTKDYRITVWLKKENTRNGQGQLGIFCRDALSKFTAIDVATAENQPYAVLFSNLLPELDKWYLVVGYIYNSLYMGTTVEGGVYDSVTGNKVMDARSTFRFHPQATTLEHFSYLYDTDVNNRQDFWDPRIEVIDSDMPTIPDLLAGRDAAMPTELVFDYDASGNNRLRSKPEDIDPLANTEANDPAFANNPVQYPPGYFDEPVSEEDRKVQLERAIKVYPNPTHGELFTTWDEEFQDMVVDVIVTDFAGKAIPVKFLPGAVEAQVNLRSYPSGIYLASFLLNDGSRIEKKIVKK